MIPIHLVLSNTITFIQVLKLLLDTLIILMAGTKFEFKIEHIIFGASLTILCDIYNLSVPKHIN